MADTELHYTFATWVFSLFVAGVVPQDGGVAEPCRAASEAGDRDAGEAAGREYRAAATTASVG
jgi:hypothetical protein